MTYTDGTIPLCRHCGTAKAYKSRGLCTRCYDKPAVRALYPKKVLRSPTGAPCRHCPTGWGRATHRGLCCRCYEDAAVRALYPPPPPRPKLCLRAFDRAEAARLYALGCGDARLAAHFGCDPSTVCKWRRGAGLAPLRKPAPPKTPRPATPVNGAARTRQPARGEPPAEPCPFGPRDPRKLAVLAERAQRGDSLFHPQDGWEVLP